MNELIKVSNQVIGQTSGQAVNARDLHTFLEVGKDFSNWIKDQIDAYGFAEGVDYAKLDSPNLANQVGHGGDRRSKEYLVSLSMAKELAMVQRTEKGKRARMYFLECERMALEKSRRAPLRDIREFRAKLDSFETNVARLLPQTEILEEAALFTYDATIKDRTAKIVKAAKSLSRQIEALMGLL